MPALRRLALAHGVDIVEVGSLPDGTIDLEALDDLVDDRVRLVLVTHMPTHVGTLTDAPEVGRVLSGSGAIYALDISQTVGQMTVDVQTIGCDVAFAPARKFLRAPRGTALLYVRQALADRLVPLTPSFGTEVDEGTGHFVLASGLRRFDQYESGFAARLGLGVAARYAMQIGLDVISEQVEQRSREVSDLLTGFDGIRLVGGRDSRGIVSFVHTSRDLFDIRARLAADGVNVWVNTPVGTPREDRENTLPSVRVSPHYVTTDDELARLRGTLRGSDLSTVRPVPSPLSLEWFGCTTFRVRVAGLTLWFDTYLDRPASILDVGLTSGQVDNADFAFISHAHYDHMLGADTVAANTGATIVGSYETTRVLRENKVPAAQLLPVSGGETIDCGHDVRVRVFPSLHSCLFAKSNPDSGAECLGDLGVSHQERSRARRRAVRGAAVDRPRARALPPVDRRSQLTRRRRTARTT